MSIALYFLIGGVGAFISDVLKDNSLELPKHINGKICLGFLGGIILGGIAGIIIDGSIETAFLGGFTGKEIITRLVNKIPVKKITRE